MLNGSAVVGRLSRWESTTWKMSPAAMYSFACRTADSYCSHGMFDVKSPSGWAGDVGSDGNGACICASISSSRATASS